MESCAVAMSRPTPFSHGSAAAHLRRGGMFNSGFLRSVFLNPTAKELLKWCRLAKDIVTIKTAPFLSWYVKSKGNHREIDFINDHVFTGPSFSATTF